MRRARAYPGCRKFGKQSRRRPRWLLAIAVAVAFSGTAATAQAAVTIGSALESPNSGHGYAITASQRVLPDRLTASPHDGVIVRWRIRNGGSASASLVKLRVIRGVGAGSTSAGSSQTETLPAMPGIYTYDARLPVLAGDFIGVDCCAGVLAGFFRAVSGPRMDEWNPPLADGETRQPFQRTSYEVLLNADVEPDADRDGFGDETQDACPTNALTQGPCPVAIADRTAPRLDASVRPATFAVDRRGERQTPTADKAARKGTTFSYTLSEPSRVAFVIERRELGARVPDRGCVGRRRSGRPRCIRHRRVGAFTAAGAAGQNKERFSGRIGRRSLRPGRYRAVIVATDASGNRSQPERLRFRVVRR